MGHSASTPQLTPFTSPSRYPVSHKQAVSEDEAHKLLLLEVLFKSIDEHSQQWVDRQTITDWVRTEPYLQRDELAREAQRMLNKLSHDEDSSRCTYREFVLAFLAFTTDEVQLLVINLLRSASCDRPAVLDASAAAESERAAGYSDLHDDKDSRTLFLLDTIFHAIDTDDDESVSQHEYANWLVSDPFFDLPEQSELQSVIARCSDLLDKQPVMDRYVFLSHFASLARRHVKLLLIHLLRRTTQHVVKVAKLQRKRSIVALHRGSLAMTAVSGPNSAPSSTTASPALQSRTTSVPTTAMTHASDSVDSMEDTPALHLEAEEGEAEQQAEALSVQPSPHPQLMQRRHSILVGGVRRRSTMHGLRLTLLGQSMIQHDLRETKRGAECLAALQSELYGDVIFSELESAILTSGMQAIPTRNTVFFHAAEPCVIDCLQQLHVNLLGLSNNHTGDLGVEGVKQLLHEMQKRQLTYAGAGLSLHEAAAPCYLDTANGRCALVSFASKVPIGSDATAERPGVNAVWMADMDSQKLNKADVKRVIDSIASAAADADVVIAYQHNHYWEKSNVNEASCLSTWKRKLAHKCIDAGANIYVGHGDPRLQGIEIYKGCVILYCLGSLFFQTKTEVGFYGAEVWESVIVQVHCHKGEEEEEEEEEEDGSEERGAIDEARARAKGCKRAAWSEEKSEHAAAGQNGNASDAESDDDSEQPLRAASYSIKLVPIVLNEVGDGWDERHEHVVKGNVIAEKQRTEDAEVLASLSRPSSPDQLKGPMLSPLMLPRASLPAAQSTSTLHSVAPVPSASSSSSSAAVLSSVEFETVPSFLSVPAFSLANSPARKPSPPPVAVTSPPTSPHRVSSLPTNSNRLYVPPIGLTASAPPSPLTPATPLSAAKLAAAPSPRNDELTESSSYALHLSTRGLPRRAGRDEAVSILHKLQTMSAEWGTVIEVDELSDGSVVGWVSTSREQELQHPFLRPRGRKANTKQMNGSIGGLVAVSSSGSGIDALPSSQRVEMPVEVG